MRQLLLACLMAVLAGAAQAGIRGQAAPSTDQAARLRKAAREIAGAGDAAAARSDLYLAVEAAPASDLTELIEPALGDNVTYTGTIAIFQDAYPKASKEQQAALLYNAARLHYLRARRLPSAYRSEPLSAASATAARFEPRTADPVLWELAGDIESEKGDVEKAVLYYDRIALGGGPRALSRLRIGQAYERRYMFDRAENAYNDGLKADGGPGGGKRMRHLLYQSLASLNLERNRLKEAEYALMQSSRVSQDDDAPFRMRLDIARRFINQGYFKAAGDYLRAVVRFQPDDAEARRMLAAASAGRRL